MQTLTHARKTQPGRINTGLVVIEEKHSTMITVNVEYLRSYKHQENDKTDVIKYSEKCTWTEAIRHCNLAETIKAHLPTSSALDLMIQATKNAKTSCHICQMTSAFHPNRRMTKRYRKMD